MICTLAPGMAPNCTSTELRVTAWPMSRISPDPCLRPPKTGLPRYHCVSHAVARLLSMAMLALALVSSKPPALPGLSTTGDDGGGPPECPRPPAGGAVVRFHNEEVAAMIPVMASSISAPMTPTLTSFEVPALRRGCLARGWLARGCLARDRGRAGGLC